MSNLFGIMDFNESLDAAGLWRMSLKRSISLLELLMHTCFLTELCECLIKAISHQI